MSDQQPADREPPKLHVISSGEYSDYSITAILEQQPEKDFASLVEAFDLLTLEAVGEAPDDDEEWWEWQNKRNVYWGANDRDKALVLWLKAKHGYVEYEFDDKNV
jgi:hypothetical protein